MGKPTKTAKYHNGEIIAEIIAFEMLFVSGTTEELRERWVLASKEHKIPKLMTKVLGFCEEMGLQRPTTPQEWFCTMEYMVEGYKEYDYFGYKIVKYDENTGKYK